MTTKQPSRQELQNELSAIRAQLAQQKRMTLYLSARTAKCSKALLDLAPEQPTIGGRTMR